MGKYTAYDSALVDATIGGHMHTLAALCQEAFSSNLAAVVLSGSFGRGEGSVLLHSDGRVEPMRDYDTRLIVHNPVPMRHVERVRADFMARTGLGNTDERFSGEHGFSMTLEPLTVSQLRTSFVRGRDLRAYDHMHASTIIWGIDHAADLHFAATEIPLVNGLRFLYQKMVGLVGHFPGLDRLEVIHTGTGDGKVGCSALTSQWDATARDTLLYECDKTFIEICTALTLLAGCYLPSYGARAAQFARKWREWFPGLAEELPDLAYQVSRATAEKLRPGSTPPASLPGAFYAARHALLTVHNHYVRALYGVRTDGAGGGVALRKSLQRDYFRVEAARWLRERKCNFAPARRVVCDVYQRATRLRMARGLGFGTARAAVEALRPGRGEAAQIDIFLAAWYTLRGSAASPIKGDLHPAHQLLDRLPGGGNHRLGSTAPNRLAEWDYYRITRERLTEAYASWEHTR